MDGHRSRSIRLCASDDVLMSKSVPDVRMHGFSSRTSVADALAWLDRILDEKADRPTEVVPLTESAGRVLAQDVISSINVPQFTRSMMDGYAVRAADVAGASAYNPLTVREVGASLPGRPFEGRLSPGDAVRIMTGAPLPNGADAVLRIEYVERSGATVRALSEVPPGKHVGLVGEDVGEGDRVLSAGRRLRPQDLGVLSSIGIGSVEVVDRPRVRIVVTGDELVPAGTVPQESRIADANGPMLSALVERDGGIAAHPGIVSDERERIEAALHNKADVILVSGGSSCGEEDHAPSILAERGELSVHGIAMRPSSPAGMGTLGARLVFLLPGNPVSCLCAYDFFAGRAVRSLGGRSREWPYRCIEVPLSRKLVSQVGRTDYARVRLDGGGAEPLAISGASILSSTTRADGFVVVPADREGYPAGASVQVWLYDL